MPRGYKWPEDRRQALRELWRKGTPCGEIAQALKVSKQMVYGMARRLGLPHHPLAHTRHNAARAALTFSLLLAFPSLAHEADQPYSTWYNSLAAPSGTHCCSLADCHTTSARTVGDHYEVWVNDSWLPVPEDKILQRMDNPTGEAVVCWRPYNGIMCFVRGTDT